MHCVPQIREVNMLKHNTLAQLEIDPKMEAEFQEIRRQQDKDLEELDRARQEFESQIEEELYGKTQGKWIGCAPKRQAE
jgi:hypothetical protein